MRPTLGVRQFDQRPLRLIAPTRPPELRIETIAVVDRDVAISGSVIEPVAGDAYIEVNGHEARINPLSGRFCAAVALDAMDSIVVSLEVEGYEPSILRITLGVRSEPAG